MQRIYPCELTAEQYASTDGHRTVVPETVCPRCGHMAGLHRHGHYQRGVTGQVGRIVRIAVARFLCQKCRGTVSYLPWFALTYRLVGARSFEAFLDGHLDHRDVQSWAAVLEDYRRRMDRRRRVLWQRIGCGLGRAPPRDGRLWPWLKMACGGLTSAARQLAHLFGETLFGSYQCHQSGQRDEPSRYTSRSKEEA